MDKYETALAKVLIVDDMRTNQIMTKGLLKPYNMQIDMCGSGKEAIEAVQTKDYDLVFMDYKMPEMDGVEATRLIREMGIKHRHFHELPIIALTANAVNGTKEMFLENGFNDCLTKPINAGELSAIIMRWAPMLVACNT